MDLSESGKGSNFKITRLDYDAIRDQPSDACLFCLTRQQQMALLALIEPLGWKKRWYSPSNAAIDTDWIDDFAAQLAGELMTDHCDLATDITNILTQITNINTQIDIINTNIVNISNYTNIDITVINQATTIYNQQIIDQWKTTNPKIPDISFGQDSGDTTQPNQFARWWALEIAVMRWAKTIFYRVGVDYSPSNSSLPGLLTDLATVGGVLLGVLWTEPLGSLPASVDTIIAAATNATVVKNVVCALANALYLYPISYVNLGAALASVSWTAGTSEYYLHATLTAAWAADTLQYNYNALLSILQTTWLKYYLTANSWTTPDGCTLGSYNGGGSFWDFENTGNKGAWLLFHGKMVSIAADPYAGGIRATPRYNGGERNHDIWLELQYASVNTVGKKLRLKYYVTQDLDGDNSGGNSNVYYYFAQPSGGVCPAESAWGQGSAVQNNWSYNTDYTIDINFPAIGNTCGIRIWNGSKNGGSIHGIWYLKSIQIL